MKRPSENKAGGGFPPRHCAPEKPNEEPKAIHSKEEKPIEDKQKTDKEDK